MNPWSVSPPPGHLTGPGPPGAIDEKLNARDLQQRVRVQRLARTGQAERRHRPAQLPRDTQRLAAGGEHHHRWRRDQRRDQVGGRADDVLAVVDDQQGTARWPT